MKVLLSILADYIFGTPKNFPNMLDLLNFIIEKEKDLASSLFKDDSSLKIAGLIVSLLNIIIIFLLIRFIVNFFSFNKYLQFVISIHLGYMTISSRYLDREATSVKQEMKKSTKRGRARLNPFIARDTKNLSDSGIIRASVENLAKDTCDLVLAPIFYLVFGVEFAYVYKIVSIMNEKLSYDKDLYDTFGKANRLFNDILNFIPARLTSFFMLMGSTFKFDTSRAIKITKRDHGNHININYGWPQSTLAGLLGIMIGGGAFYNGLYIERPTIGDDTRPLRAKDIDDSIKIMYRSMVSFCILYIIGLVIYKVFIGG